MRVVVVFAVELSSVAVVLAVVVSAVVLSTVTRPVVAISAVVVATVAVWPEVVTSVKHRHTSCHAYVYT